MALIGVELDKDILFSKDVDYRVLAAIRTYSWYDKDKDIRKIQIKKTGYPFISSVTKGLSRYKYNKAMKYLKDAGYLTIDEDDERYYNMKGTISTPFFAIDNGKFRNILKCLDNDCLKLFAWLTSMHSHSVHFGNNGMVLSYKRILSDVYGIEYCTKNIAKARKCFERLVELELVDAIVPWYYKGRKCILVTKVNDFIELNKEEFSIYDLVKEEE